MTKIQKKIIFLLLIFSFIILNPIHASEPWAKREMRLFIDEPTILKGYTVVAGDNEFKLGVRDKAISQAATAVIRELNESHIPSGPTVNIAGEPTNLKRISSAWEFDFLAEPRIGVLNKPLYAAIKTPPTLDKHNNTNMKRKVMHFWDGTTNTWKPLPGNNDLENNLTRAIIHLPYAILAVFESNTDYEAYASWYGDALTPSSKFNGASNNHQIGSYVNVCRLDNLKKCVKIKIVSTGPYVDNRIVDLTKTAFSKIGNPGGGILPVRVTPAP